MSLSSIFVLDINGNVLIFRDYKGDMRKNIIEEFMPLLKYREELGVAPPILRLEDISFGYIQFNDLYIVTLMTDTTNVTLAFTFIHKFMEIAAHYLGRLEEESIKDNFVILYELLDEIMDFGYPQTTDPKILKTYIMQEGCKLKTTTSIPSVVTNVVSWRPEGVKYRRNEVFVDVIESVNLLVNSKGAILTNEVSGCVKMKVHLSGMPQLRLGLSDKLLLALNSPETVHFEDVKFHQCVQLSRISDKNIYFVPPDGDFDLMTYRLNIDFKPLIFVETKVDSTSCRIEYRVKLSARFKANSTASSVEVILPVCGDVDSPNFKCSAGCANYSPEKEAVLWKLKYLCGGTENFLNVSFKLSSIKSEEPRKKVPIQVKFVIPYFTVSGLQIKFMKVIEKTNYKALTWVKYTTKNGEYLVVFE